METEGEVGRLWQASRFVINSHLADAFIRIDKYFIHPGWNGRRSRRSHQKHMIQVQKEINTIKLT